MAATDYADLRRQLTDQGLFRGRPITAFASAADLETVIKMGMEEGVTQSWDKLAAHLAQSQQ